MSSGEPTTYAQALEKAQAAVQLAEQMRQRELETVVAEMKEKIRFYGISAKDLGFEDPARALEPIVRQKSDKRSTVLPKYRSAAGETWSGRGKQPAWMLKYIAEGGKAQDLLIKEDGEP